MLYNNGIHAVVVQLVECLPSKEKVAGSNPVHRSKFLLVKKRRRF